MNDIPLKTSASPLPLSGERLLTCVENESVVEHLHRYALARPLCAQKKVLDIACGEGYGSALLAATASRVIGMDLDAAAVAHATAKYVRPNLEFKAGSCTDIQLADETLDVVVSFETIEHHDRHDEMLREIKRVLKPAGLCLISTPDRHNYSEKRHYKNPYHVRELDLQEFSTLLARSFRHTAFAFQAMCYGSLIVPHDCQVNGFDHLAGSFAEVAAARHEPMYYLALASDGPLPAINASFFDGNAVLKKQMRAILSSASYRLGHTLLEPARLLARLLRHQP